MKSFPYVFLTVAFLWMNMTEISGYEITITDRARTTTDAIRWTQEEYGSEFLLRRLNFLTTEEVPEGVKFTVGAFFQPLHKKYSKMDCIVTLLRPKNKVRLVRKDIDCRIRIRPKRGK